MLDADWGSAAATPHQVSTTLAKYGELFLPLITGKDMQLEEDQSIRNIRHLC